MTPEERARQTIDELLDYAGWSVQDRETMNLFDPAHRGVAVREAYLATGYADYLLFVDGKALGVIEAKKVGVPLSGVEAQSARYAEGLKAPMQAWLPDQPLPFRYESTGVETYFTNTLDPEPSFSKSSFTPISVPSASLYMSPSPSFSVDSPFIFSMASPSTEIALIIFGKNFGNPTFK